MWSDAPILDPDAIARLSRLGGPGLIAELLRLFDEQTADHTRVIVAAQDAGDFDGVRRSAHSLVSSAGNLGARRLQGLVATLERAAAGREARTVAALLPELGPAVDAARDALTRCHAESTS